MESRGTRSELVPHVSARAAQKQQPLRYPGFLAMLCFWTAISALSLLRNYVVLGRRTPFSGSVWIGLLGCSTCYLPWAGLSLIVFRLEQRFPLGTERWLRNLGYLLLASLPFCTLASPIMIGLEAGVHRLLGSTVPPTGAWFFWFWHIPVAEAMFWSSAGGGYFFRTLMKLQAQEQEAASLALEKSRLETSLRQTQLEALRARLNPHFLFNSLQNISVLAQQDPRLASRMLAKLGDLLRAVLRGETKAETTLSEEVELARAYCAIEQMRFGDRLQTAFHMSDNLQTAIVPRFLLQPLLENAIVHGLREAPNAGSIAVEGSKVGNELVLTVADNGVGPAASELGTTKLGVGLGTACEVLERLYPEQHTVALRRLPEGGTEVRITLPLRFQSPSERAN